MNRRGFLTLSGAAGAVAVAALAGYRLLPDETAPAGEPRIRYGAERCARCRMIISDVQFAAAWRGPSGGEQHFDDIGCMVSQARERPPAADSRYWVHDYESEAWLTARDAFYIVSAKINSPMGYGVAASGTRERAEQIAGRLPDARVHAWAALSATLEQKV
jgi:copper chaperone NosL